MQHFHERTHEPALELGGNDAGIVLPDTRIEPLLENLFWGCFINAGQTCAALKAPLRTRKPVRGGCSKKQPHHLSRDRNIVELRIDFRLRICGD
jgi:hypothetical protein